MNKQIKENGVKYQFPLELKLLWKVYDIDYVSESVNELIIAISYNKNAIKRYVFRKDADWYINEVYMKNMLCRNFEWYMYWKEVGECMVHEDDRMNIFNKRWRQWTLNN